jgi:hypothetical protein
MSGNGSEFKWGTPNLSMGQQSPSASAMPSPIQVPKSAEGGYPYLTGLSPFSGGAQGGVVPPMVGRSPIRLQRDPQQQAPSPWERAMWEQVSVSVSVRCPSTFPFYVSFLCIHTNHLA